MTPIRDPREQKTAECEKNVFIAEKAGIFFGAAFFWILSIIASPFIDLDKTQFLFGAGFCSVIGAAVGQKLVYRHYRIHHGL